jgi:rubrerythrin
MSDTALLTFLAYATELEQESEERYAELAASMANHHNMEVSSFFERMAMEASNHLAEVTLLSAGQDLPRLDPWEFEWPDTEPPETTSYEALHYRMSLREAMQLALQNERAAERFYRDYATRSEDREVTRLAVEFAEEEAQHAQALELLLQDTPEVAELGRREDDAPHVPE